VAPDRTRDGPFLSGGSDTGKSSILNLINYCLGASSLDTYEEIEIKGKYCLLEVEILGIKYTIRRDIFNVKADIEVYYGAYKSIDETFPKYYSPNYIQDAEDGVFSEFLLQAMRIPLVRIKEAPSKEVTKMVNLSFRDIFKYNYLDQDRIGSKKLFGENYAILTKLKETFKLMYNVLDEQITELEGRISVLITDKNNLTTKNNSVASFLKETKVESLAELTFKKENLENELYSLQESIKQIDLEIVGNSEELNYLRNEISNLEGYIRKLYQEHSITELEIKQNIALRNEYRNDMRKMEATIEALDKFPKITDKKLDCPLCDTAVNVSKLKQHFNDSDNKSIKGELNSLRRRMRDLDKIYKNLKEQESNSSKGIQDKTLELDEMRLLLDKQSVNIVSPYLNQRDALSYRTGTVQSDIKNSHHFYKIRLQQSIHDAEIIELQRNIDELKITLTDLRKDAPSLDKILEDIGNKVKEILIYVGVKNPKDISISSTTYLPIIRGRNYENITSGGVRTVSSVAYFLSLMIYAINNPVNYPSFLMIDTITKYLGKVKERDLESTNREEDEKEGMTDYEKHENIYRYLLTLSKYKDSFQLIIVDNDIPDTLYESLKGFVRKHFSTNIPGTEIGFIDDANINISTPVEDGQFDLFGSEEERWDGIDFNNDDEPAF
jgi:conjugal transfer/entry exclusion protein